MLLLCMDLLLPFILAYYPSFERLIELVNSIGGFGMNVLHDGVFKTWLKISKNLMELYELRGSFIV